MAKGPINRFRDPYESPDDVSHATMFFVVILLLVGVAGVLYYGNSELFSTVQDTSSFIARPEFTPRPATPTPPPAPLTNATPVPLTTPTPQSTAPPAETPGSAATPTTVTSPTPPPPPPTATATRALLRVANTDGDGVYIRRTPNMDDKIVPWREGTVLEALGERVQANGVEWEKVRDPQGNVGWVPAQWVAPAQ